MKENPAFAILYLLVCLMLPVFLAIRVAYTAILSIIGIFKGCYLGAKLGFKGGLVPEEGKKPPVMDLYKVLKALDTRDGMVKNMIKKSWI